MLTKEQGMTQDLCLHPQGREIVQGQEAKGHINVCASGRFCYRIMA